MRTKLLDATGQKTFALVLDRGDEVVAELTAFAKAESMTAAHFTAIGAFSAVTLGYFERASKQYLKIPVREQVEVLSLIGDIAIAKEGPQVHAHVVIGGRDGAARGGHLIDGRVWPTLEVILVESPRHLHRRHDADTGLALIAV